MVSHIDQIITQDFTFRMFTAMFFVYGLNLLGMMVPGPDIFMVTRNALRYPFAVSWWTGLGIATGCLAHVSFAIFGVSLLAAYIENIFVLVRFAGASYLLVVGFIALRTKAEDLSPSELGADRNSPHPSRQDTADALQNKQRFGAYRDGLLCNVLNVKAFIFFTSIFSQIVSPSLPIMIRVSYMMGIPLMAFLWFTLFARFLAFPRFKKSLARSELILTRLMGVFFILFAVLALSY